HRSETVEEPALCDVDFFWSIDPEPTRSKAKPVGALENGLFERWPIDPRADQAYVHIAIGYVSGPRGQRGNIESDARVSRVHCDALRHLARQRVARVVAELEGRRVQSRSQLPRPVQVSSRRKEEREAAQPLGQDRSRGLPVILEQHLLYRGAVDRAGDGLSQALLPSLWPGEVELKREQLDRRRGPNPAALLLGATGLGGTKLGEVGLVELEIEQSLAA